MLITFIKVLVCLLHLLFFLQCLLDREDSEILKAEPQNERISVSESQVKENHPPTKNNSIKLLRKSVIYLKRVKL